MLARLSKRDSCAKSRSRVAGALAANPRARRRCACTCRAAHRTWAVRHSVRRGGCRQQAEATLTVVVDSLLDLGDHVLLAGDLETDLCEVEGVGDGTSDGCGDAWVSVCAGCGQGRG